MTQSCCTAQGTGKFFSKSVKRFERRYRNGGLDRAQRKIVDGLVAAGINGKSILEIGCGVGGLHLNLLQQGAAHAHGIELSEAMITEARKFAGQLNLSERVSYTLGDFATEPTLAESADVVVMDKVLCCYASPAKLIHKAALKCRALLAVSYPRKALLPMVMFRTSEIIGKTFRSSFYPMYHAPELLEQAVENEGFGEIRAEVSPVWQIRIYRRKIAIEPDAESSRASAI